MLRVAIADHYTKYAEASRNYLSQFEDITVVGNVTRHSDLLRGLSLTQPDVLLIRLNLPEIGGLEAVRQSLILHRATNALVYSQFAPVEGLLKAVFSAGAVGYFGVDDPTPLIELVRTAGEIKPLPPNPVRQIQAVG